MGRGRPGPVQANRGCLEPGIQDRRLGGDGKSDHGCRPAPRATSGTPFWRHLRAGTAARQAALVATQLAPGQIKLGNKGRALGAQGSRVEKCQTP